MITEKDIEQFSKQCNEIFKQISRDVIGQKEVVENTVIAMIAGGNVLLEGVPGVGKTRLVRTLGRVFDLPFSRIQFTPDLMPADVTGTNIIVKDENGNSSFQFQKGPIFSNIILADEINRATPKTQSALLEAMQEHTVTVMGVSRKLEEPFFVLATQNPIEQDGTYPLPEAQMDRFMMKAVLTYPTAQEEQRMLAMLTRRGSDTVDQHALTGDTVSISDVEFLRSAARRVHVSDAIMQYAVDIAATSRGAGTKPVQGLSSLVRLGASPRASIALVRIGQANALLQGRDSVIPEDVKAFAHEVLRHRILMTFEALADGITSDQVVDSIVQAVPVP